MADEPVSMLDVSIRGEILNLMLDLSVKGVTFLYITHDLATARHICDRIAVMYLGKMVEKVLLIVWSSILYIHIPGL